VFKPELNNLLILKHLYWQAFFAANCQHSDKYTFQHRWLKIPSQTPKRPTSEALRSGSSNPGWSGKSLESANRLLRQRALTKRHERGQPMFLHKPGGGTLRYNLNGLPSSLRANNSYALVPYKYNKGSSLANVKETKNLSTPASFMSPRSLTSNEHFNGEVEERGSNESCSSFGRHSFCGRGHSHAMRERKCLHSSFQRRADRNVLAASEFVRKNTKTVFGKRNRIPLRGNAKAGRARQVQLQTSVLVNAAMQLCPRLYFIGTLRGN
ncbi:unnamed protein product, partial [Protopolystoma xenopodis]